MELVHIDYLTIEAPENYRSSKDINILVITDHFTRYAQAQITSSQKGHVVAKTLWEHLFVHYGFPEKILLDQGRNFESVLISELCELAQIKKLRTTPYRPEGNGSCERFNRTLISKLGTLPGDFKNKWPHHVSTLTYTCNCTRSTFFMGDNLYFLLILSTESTPLDYLKPWLINMYRNYNPDWNMLLNKVNEFCKKEAEQNRDLIKQ